MDPTENKRHTKTRPTNERGEKRPRLGGVMQPADEQPSQPPEVQALLAELAGLKEQIKEKDEQHQVQLKEKDEQHQGQLKEKDEQHQVQLKEKDEQHQVQLKEKDEHLSVKSLLTRGIPKMKVNPACKPSIIPNSAAQKNVSEYRAAMEAWDEKTEGKKPERPKFHDPAKIFQKTIPTELLKFKVNLENRQGLIKSSLGVKFDKCGELDKCGSDSLPHINEASPQDYLSMVMEDALACCGLVGRALVAREASLFSLRPDLVTVVSEGQLLYVAEVKNPSESDIVDVFGSETAAGQVLNYLKGLKQHGMDLPFCLLSTFNHSVVARLDSPDSGVLDDKYESLLKRGSKRRLLVSPTKGEQQRQGKKPPFSPTKLKDFRLKTINTTAKAADTGTGRISKVAANSSETTNSEAADSSSADFDYKGRYVAYSQVFDNKDLFMVLALLTKSSFESLQDSKETREPCLPQEGDMLEKELCTLYGDGFSWEKVKFKQVTYNNAPRTDNFKKCHTLCVLGQGSRGRTILCSSPTGKLYAAKLFLVAPSSRYNEEERTKEILETLGKNREEAEVECERWIELAPQHKKYCRVIELNGIPALTMPFFPPVPVKERKNALNLIKSRLEDVAQNNQYRYKAQDLRWRHFGCRFDGAGEMEITLLDLGSLEKIGSDQISDIGNQINSLKETIETEPPEKPGFVLP